LRPGGGLFMAGLPPRGLWERLEARLLNKSVSRHDSPSLYSARVIRWRESP
jgi:hypothetical protein